VPDKKNETLKTEEILNETSKLMNDDVSFMDALVHYAQKNDIEIELIGDIVRNSPILKSMIQEDAEELRLVERSGKLPI